MAWFINTSAFLSGFPVPCEVVDKQLKLVTSAQLKTIVYIMRNSSTPISEENIAKEIGITTTEVQDALLYWVGRGVIGTDKKTGSEEKQKKTATPERAEKPSRTDVAKRGLEDPKIMFILREAQSRFARNLKTNESSTLVWLYEDKGMDISVMLFLLEYAASEKRLNIGFIEKTALKWLDGGIETVADAEKVIAEEAKRKLAWNVVQGVFGIEKRKPSEKELEYSDTWINKWGISKELLKSAYDECVDRKAKISIPYIAKILEEWHKKGYEKREDVKSKKDEKYDFGTYDIDLFEKMLDKDE